MKGFRRIITLCVALLSVIFTNAQNKPIYLLDDFVNGIIQMKNGSKALEKMNYNVIGRKMLFLHNEDLMELTNIAMVESVSVGERKFIPDKNLFWEVIPTTNGTVYVSWHYKEINKGKKGALGLPTQSSVVSVEYREAGNPYTPRNLDITETIIQNEYKIYIDDKPIRFKNKKSLLKQLPNHSSQIETYLKEHSVQWNSADDLIKLADYCLGL